MNIDLCKKCKLKPYLMIFDFSCKERNLIMKQMIVCTKSSRSVEAIAVADVSDETLNRIEQHLTYNGYKTDGYTTLAHSKTMISLFGNIENSEVLKDIEMNHQCLLFVEQEMDFFSKNEH